MARGPVNLNLARPRNKDMMPSSESDTRNFQREHDVSGVKAERLQWMHHEANNKHFLKDSHPPTERAKH